MLQFYEDSNYATKSNEKWQKIVYLCFMIHLNFPDSLKVPFCVAQKFKVRPIPWFGLLSFSFRYRHRTLVSYWTLWTFKVSELGKKYEINENLLSSTPRTPLAPQGGSELNCFIYLINIFSFLFAGWPHLDWASVKAGIWCGNWSKSCFSRGSKNPGKFFK